MDHSSHHKRKTKSVWKNPIVIVCVLAVGYWLYTYHAEHALGFLPYAILLLCPIMHIFMHGGHGEHGGHDHGDRRDKTPEQEGN